MASQFCPLPIHMGVGSTDKVGNKHNETEKHKALHTPQGPDGALLGVNCDPSSGLRQANKVQSRIQHACKHSRYHSPIRKASMFSGHCLFLSVKRKRVEQPDKRHPARAPTQNPLNEHMQRRFRNSFQGLSTPILDLSPFPDHLLVGSASTHGRIL